MIPDIDAEHTERLLLRIPMRALFADFLVAEAAAERGGHQLRMAQCLQPFVQVVQYGHEEFDGILLFA